MTEKELIQKIQLLKQIKPNKDWVVSVKSEILGRELKQREQFSWIEILRVFSRPAFIRPAFVTITSLFVIIGTFSLAQNSLPGDFLFPIKQLAEKGQTAFTSETEKPNLQLEFANQRVNELAQITSKSGSKNGNLVAALQALNNDLSVASNELKNVQLGEKKDLAIKTEELIKKTQEVLTTMQATGVEGINNALAQVVESQIKDLENGTLTDGQKELLSQAKQDFSAGNFTQALEKIWRISNR